MSLEPYVAVCYKLVQLLTFKLYHYCNIKTVNNNVEWCLSSVSYFNCSTHLPQKIQTLLAPPKSEEVDKKSRKLVRDVRRSGRATNHDTCDSCREGGDLLCCDHCPAAFHLQCWYITLGIKAWTNNHTWLMVASWCSYCVGYTVLQVLFKATPSNFFGIVTCQICKSFCCFEGWIKMLAQEKVTCTTTQLHKLRPLMPALILMFTLASGIKKPSLSLLKLLT